MLWLQVSLTLTYRVPSGTWKPGDFNFICPGPEMAWNLSQKVKKPEQNKKFSIKPGMLRYTKFQYYIEIMFSTFCTLANLECLGVCLLVPKLSTL